MSMLIYNSQLFEMNRKELIIREQANQLRQTIERCARQWLSRKHNSDCLLKGEFLIIAEKFYMSSGNRLSSNALRFIIASIQFREQSDNLAKVKKTSRLMTASFTATIAIIGMFLLSTKDFDGAIDAEIVRYLDRLEKSI